jgi:hypothetical protein
VSKEDAAVYPANRAVMPEDVTDAVKYLMRARFVNGRSLVVDGGASGVRNEGWGAAIGKIECSVYDSLRRGTSYAANSWDGKLALVEGFKESFKNCLMTGWRACSFPLG